MKHQKIFHNIKYKRKPLLGILNRFRRTIYKTTFITSIILITWIFINTISLISASSKSIDAFFILGGSITREIYAANLAKQYPKIPILISKGSQDPCIFLIFRQKNLKAPDLQNIWLEKCANSTFDNFYYGIPILRNWHSRKIKLITSPTHLPRAKWMAQILFGAHGIWVETETVKEKGIPGNKEHWLKTGLDVTRSILWTALSHIVRPQCPEIIKLADVDMKDWLKKGFKCEHQQNLNLQDTNIFLGE
ncbi:MAG: YdcF family protein [Mastigocoleus sp.]